MEQVEAERDRLRDELTVKAGWYSPDDYQNLAEIVHRREIEREELRKQIEELRSQPDTPSYDIEQLKDFTDKALASLKMGKQASCYRTAQNALKKFVELMATPTE